MWIDENGVSHSVGLGTDEPAVSVELARRIGEANNEVLLATAQALSAYLDGIFERVALRRSTQEQELPFVEMELPLSERLFDVASEPDLTAAIVAALDSSPIRWQIELCLSAIDSVGNELDDRRESLTPG